MLRVLREWLRTSSPVHIRKRAVSNLADLVKVIDRFVDGKLRYPLEWDDFISWKHANPTIELLRERITNLEPSLISRDPARHSEAIAALLSARNDAAAIAALPPRLPTT